MKKSVDFLRIFSCSWLLLTPIIGCQAKHRSGSKELEATTTAAPVAGPNLDEVLYFRNLFHKFALAQGLSEQDVQKAVLLPDADVMRPSPEALAANDATAVNQAILHQAKDWTAAKFYQNGREAPFADVDVERPFAEGPATFIVVPGILGEFIDREVFYEVFHQPTAFASTYAPAIKKLTDPSFDLRTMSTVDVNLSERVHLGGSEDPVTHQPRVQAIFLKAGFGSMETLGKNTDNAAIYLRRINKIFSQIPLEQCRRIYLIGYSQGTDVVFDMIDQAKKQPDQYPFLANLKGLITLSGVIYGTETADDAYNNPNSSVYKTLHELERVFNGLAPAPAKGGFINAIGQEFKDWKELVNLVRTLSKQPAETPSQGEQLENLKMPVPNPFEMVEMLSHFFSDFLKPSVEESTARGKVKRAATLFNAVLVGSKSLSTQARTDWWASHTLPSDLPIYTVATSMPDASRPDYRSPLLSDAFFGSDTIDYATVLRPAFYKLEAVSGVPLNDSQVLTAKELIYPSLVTKWNAKQQPFPVHFVGVMGTHHWGIAFDNVFATANGAANKFPRRAFIEALGAFVLSRP